MDGTTQVMVNYDNADISGIRFHHVPRELFDLIPGESVSLQAGARSLWVKTLMLCSSNLASDEGQFVELKVYCMEPKLTPGFPIETFGNDGEPLLSGIEPVRAGEYSPV